VSATSAAGAVATWATPSGIPGATPGSCTPTSGSTFPLFSTTVSCQVLDAANDIATGTFQVEVVPTTQYFTRALIPADGATLAGGQLLDAAAGDGPGVTKVNFELTGGTLNQAVIATSVPTLFGWLASWDTTTVPNGTYTLQSVATDAANNVSVSTGTTVTVDNPPPSTVIGLPSNGATVTGSRWLDASASGGVTSVRYELTGGSLNQAVIATAVPTIVGWLAGWDSTSVTNGTYTLQSVASYAGGVTGTSPGVTITVSN
jgi:Bacterial Ig domain